MSGTTSSRPAPARTLRLRLPRLSGRAGTHRRGLRLPEYLACVGIALIGWWPGEALSTTHLTMVAMCLLPLAVRTLLRWEEFATPPYGVPAAVSPAAERPAAPREQDADTYRTSFERALVGLAVLDATDDGLVVRQANRALSDLLGPVEPGIDLGLLVAPEERALARDAALDLAQGRLDSWRGEVAFVVRPATGAAGSDGRCWLQLALVRLPSGDAGPARVSLQAVDVTQRRVEEERLRTLALHDDLTGLPARTILLDRLTMALAGANRGRGCVALLFCDLDDFKTVNDDAGHAAGDAVLVQVARRLTEAVRPTDTVARLGGDEFVVLCPDVPDLPTARAIAERLEDAFLAPFAVDAHQRAVGISVGLALSWPGATRDELLARADAAMYAVKQGHHRSSAAAHGAGLAPTG